MNLKITLFKSFLLIRFSSAQGFENVSPSITLPPSTITTTDVQNPISSSVSILPITNSESTQSSVLASAPVTSLLTTMTTINAQPTSSNAITSTNGGVATTIFIVTILDSQSSTISTISFPSSTSSVTASEADTKSSSNPDTSVALFIFIGVIGAILLAACGIYAFRCISLSPSEPFRKRLRNTDAFDGMHSETNSSLKDYTSTSEQIVYPISSGRYNSMGYKYPTSIRPIRYNVSNSSLRSLSSQPGALVYPSLARRHENPEMQQNVPSDPFHNPSYAATPVNQFSSSFDPNYVGHYEYYGHHSSAIPVFYEDGSVEYFKAHPVPQPQYSAAAEVPKATPVIVRVDSIGSDLHQQERSSTSAI